MYFLVSFPRLPVSFPRRRESSRLITRGPALGEVTECNVFKLILAFFVLFLFSFGTTWAVPNKTPSLLSQYQTQLSQQAINTLKLSIKARPTLPLAQANQLFRHSKFMQAYQALLPWARLGNVTAQLEVGFMNEFGRGVPQNDQRAALWYYSAMRPNEYNVKPIARAIKAYFGLHQKVDYRMAALWFRMSAELAVDRY